MKFLVPNYSCLQNPWLGGYRPQIPVLSVLCPELNLLNPSEQNSLVRHCLNVIILSVMFERSIVSSSSRVSRWKWRRYDHQNMRNHVPGNTASHPKSPESSCTITNITALCICIGITTSMLQSFCAPNSMRMLGMWWRHASVAEWETNGFVLTHFWFCLLWKKKLTFLLFLSFQHVCHVCDSASWNKFIST